MSPDVVARPARPDDAGEVVRLLDAALAAVVGERGGDAWLSTGAALRPLEAFAARELTDDRAMVLLGTIDEVPVGILHVRLDTWRDATAVAVVHHLFVEPDAREVGVGEALLDGAIDWARSHGCLAIESLALPGDRALKNMFERFGLVARAIVVHRALD
jgi:GNAT superfamily N-acetyltransferase